MKMYWKLAGKAYKRLYTLLHTFESLLLGKKELSLLVFTPGSHHVPLHNDGCSRSHKTTHDSDSAVPDPYRQCSAHVHKKKRWLCLSTCQAKSPNDISKTLEHF